ncbi:MAG: hypothetical protein K1060chlam2_00959 [Chlamydiae bacterium]|nr:hypothetical protein [Chlamydiota bacterium]
MAKKPKSDEMTILDAMDNLSGMAELDIEVDKEGEVVGVKKDLNTFKSLNPEEREKTLSTVKRTFKTVHKYLQHVYQKDREQLQDVEMQRGIKAIMVLAEEAADKLDKCTTLFKHTHKEGKLTEIKEYKDLRTFYMNKIVKRFKEVLASEAAWEEEWGTEEKEINIERVGLKDLETVKRDKEYELFYIRKDDGRPFFNRNLLRHIKLVSDFDEIISGVEGDDPLLKVPLLLDREAQAVAENIRDDVKRERGDFFAEAATHKEVPIVADLIKLTMSLMLACNPQNLSERTTGKMCVRYLKDFHKFLRALLVSPEYKRLISHAIEETDELSRTLLYLIHAYSHAFFTRLGREREFQEYYQSLLKLAYHGELPKRGDSVETLSLFSRLFDDHDMVTNALKKYPSGPLFKTLDIFRERDEEEGFDPIIQGNPPYQLFRFSSDAFDAKCLKIPSPTLHAHISKAEVIEEFKGFLRHIETTKELGKHLLFNLQDRTSWEEGARCQALEKLESYAEFNNQLVVVTLPKKSDFYFQADLYLTIDSAQDFLKLLEEQVKSGEECGFYFSPKIDGKKLLQFVKKVIPLIHTQFFGKMAKLERKERLDFIEIFYMLLYLKILDMTRPDSFSFTCKDGVDVGAAASAGFLATLKLMSRDPKWSKAEQEHLFWVVNGAALAVRERLINNQRLSRIASALGVLCGGFEKGQQKLLKALEPLYDHPFLQKIHSII